MAAEKRHPPSVRRLLKARREGRTVRSAIFTQLLSIVMGILGLIIGAWFGWVANITLLEWFVSRGFKDFELLVLIAARFVVLCLGASLAASCLGVVLADYLQVGFYLSPKVVSPDIGRVNPFSGFKRVMDALTTSWQQLLASLAALFLLYWSVADNEQLLLLAVLGLRQASELFIAMLTVGLIKICAGLALWGVFDYLLKRRKHWASLRVSDAELRQEQREEGGDGHLKAARRALQLELAFQNIIAGIRKSRVVVVERQK